jgi:YD repeat-containing protein
MAMKSEFNGRLLVRRIRPVALIVQVCLLAACDSDPQTLEVPQQPEPYSSDISYEYDDLNRLTVVRYANGDVMRYSYDEAGNILSVEMDKAD